MATVFMATPPMEMPSSKANHGWDRRVARAVRWITRSDGVGIAPYWPRRRTTGRGSVASRRKKGQQGKSGGRMKHRGHRGTTEERQNLIEFRAHGWQGHDIHEMLLFLCGSSVPSVFKLQCRYFSTTFKSFTGKPARRGRDADAAAGPEASRGPPPDPHSRSPAGCGPDRDRGAS